MLEPWRDPLMQRAFLEVVLLGIAGGALGCWIIQYQLSYSAESLAHAILPGAAVGYLIGGWSMPAPLPGALGWLWLPGLGLIACASVLTAPLGARAAHALQVAQLKRAFALVLYLLALYMGGKALG